MSHITAPTAVAAAFSSRIVFDPTGNDILLGRGVPISKHHGNVTFREFIKTRKHDYMATGRHNIKQQIVREVLATIKERQWRFLSRIDTDVAALEHGLPPDTRAWLVASDDVALTKVKQSLREKESSSKSEGDHETPKHCRKHKSTARPITAGESLTRKIKFRKATGSGAWAESKAPNRTTARAIGGPTAPYRLPSSTTPRGVADTLPPRAVDSFVPRPTDRTGPVIHRRHHHQMSNVPHVRQQHATPPLLVQPQQPTHRNPNPLGPVTVPPAAPPASPPVTAASHSPMMTAPAPMFPNQSLLHPYTSQQQRQQPSSMLQQSVLSHLLALPQQHHQYYQRPSLLSPTPITQPQASALQSPFMLSATSPSLLHNPLTHPSSDNGQFLAFLLTQQQLQQRLESTPQNLAHHLQFQQQQHQLEWHQQQLQQQRQQQQIQLSNVLLAAQHQLTQQQLDHASTLLSSQAATAQASQGTQQAWLSFLSHQISSQVHSTDATRNPE